MTRTDKSPIRAVFFDIGNVLQGPDLTGAGVAPDELDDEDPQVSTGHPQSKPQGCCRFPFAFTGENEHAPHCVVLASIPAYRPPRTLRFAPVADRRWFVR